jgi:hypothetical protein
MIEFIYIEDKMKIEPAIVLALILYGVMSYGLVSGYLIDRGSRVTRASRPGAFWLYIAFEFIVATALLLSGLGVFG